MEQNTRTYTKIETPDKDLVNNLYSEKCESMSLLVEDDDPIFFDENRELSNYERTFFNNLENKYKCDL